MLKKYKEKYPIIKITDDKSEIPISLFEKEHSYKDLREKINRISLVNLFVIIMLFLDYQRDEKDSSIEPIYPLEWSILFEQIYDIEEQNF